MKKGIEIDDELLAKAKKLSGLDDQATVESGLRELIYVRRQGEVLQFLEKFPMDRSGARDVGHGRRR